ncbi:hypothetical protein AABB24_008807 [Solanum stoloniferum]|uniref:RNA helicase n=1 Tax=Solanum stoloniferum TaxID=62892 RepID=A0ABD2UY49_9SOLN
MIQIMQHLLGYRDADSAIAFAQTRNVTSSARHLAAELNVEVGGIVGCTTLLGYHNGIDSQIRFFNDAFLLIEAMDDHLLLGYSVIVLNQVSDRTLATDVCLGYLKKLQSIRMNLKVVIMGVGPYARELQRYFTSACVICAGPPNLDLASQKGPLMKSSSVVSVCIVLMNLGESPITFDYIDKPPKHSLDRVKKDLCFLGAMVDDWVITDLGERLAVLPLSPEIGYLLLTSSAYNCIPDVLVICSMMAGLFTNPQNNLLKDICDYLDLIKLNDAFEKKPTLLPLLLHKTGFTSVESLTESLEAARKAKVTISNAMAVVDVPVLPTCINQHPYVNLIYALIAGETHVEKKLVAGYADILELWPYNSFWLFQEL